MCINMTVKPKVELLRSASPNKEHKIDKVFVCMIKLVELQNAKQGKDLMVKA